MCCGAKSRRCCRACTTSSASGDCIAKWDRELVKDNPRRAWELLRAGWPTILQHCCEALR
jgi:hypothetical protein